jgi:hypothetical protein
MPTAVTTTRKFHLTIVAKRYANSRVVERTIKGDMILTGSNSPTDILHALQSTLTDMEHYHSIGAIEITISAATISLH